MGDPTAWLGEFAILRVIGEGGTSIVYEARRNEVELALKVFRADNQLTDAECRKFLAEADQLAKISHPNVIHVLDAGLLPDGRPFLALPLLRGETLAAHLAREPLPIASALELFYAAADAVAALHGVGLLHRDLKPENLFVEHGRLVLLDFGIARETMARASTSTQHGLVRGTPAYMAPERFFGVTTSIASEVYELAVTLHVMLTGQLPWTVATDLDARLEPTLSPALSPELARVLRTALSVRAEERQATVAKLASAVRDCVSDANSEMQTLRAPVVRPPGWFSRTRHGRRGLALGLVGAGVAVAVGSAIALSRSAKETPVSEAARKIVVVMVPRNVAGLDEDVWIGAEVAKRTARGLAGDSFAVLDEVALRAKKIDIPPPAMRATARLLEALRTRANAALVVTGSYMAERDRSIQVSFVVQDAATGSVVASTSGSGSVDHLDLVVNRSIAELRAALGERPVTTEQNADAIAVLPTGGEASREYAAGAGCMRRYALTCAQDHFERAVALAPTSALAHDALAQALQALGNDELARPEAAIALQLGRDLSPDQRLALEAHAAAATSAWPQAVKAFETLVARSGELEPALGLADAQAHAGTTDVAFATLAHARKSASDPRLDLYEARVAEKANDFVREGAAADRAIAAADELGERELGAYARLAKGWSAVTRDKPVEARAALDEALHLFTAESNKSGTARAVLDLGTLLEHQGDLAGARKMYEDALRLARELGYRSAVATALMDLGQVLAQSADSAGALARYAEALQLARSLADVNLTEEILVNAGSVASKSGDLASARKSYDEALELARAHGHHRVICAVLVNTSNIFAGMGEDQKAVEMGREALAEARQTNEPSLVDQALSTLSVHEAEVGDFKAALGRLDEIEARQQGRDPAAVTDTRVTRIGVLYDAGRGGEANALAHATLARLDKKVDPDNYGWLKLFLARYELDTGHVTSAPALLDAAADVLIAASDAQLSAEVAIAQARLLAARGQLRRAKAQLVKTRADAASAGLDGIVREIDIVAAGLDWSYTGDRAARARLGDLARDARAHGAGEMARQAEQAMKTRR